MKKLVVFTGSGVSAESGINTFRDAGGVWEGHDVMEVASPIGWHKNPDLVLDFYNQRRKQLKQVVPNSAHLGLATLEEKYDVHIITQNVDDLHERAGSTNIIHLHGELTKVRSTQNEALIYEWKDDLKAGDKCELGSQLRPHIVWFGEAVPALMEAIEITLQAEMFLIVGTSLKVYPAASLIGYVPLNAPIYYIDPKPFISYELQKRKHHKVISKKATEGMDELLKILI